ncbi:MAG: PDZ domain-containing protein [Vicinamibacterales bacterium]
MHRQHPRVSRETRLLLGIVIASLATLWVLARLRFPEQPRGPDPVGPVLAQFDPPSPFETIAVAVANLEGRVGSSLTRVVFNPRASDPTVRATERVAITIDRTHALVVLPPGEGTFESTPSVEVATGRAGLGLVRLESGPPPAFWPEDRLPTPRFVIVAEATRDGVSFRPVFVGAFTPVAGTRWPGVVWHVPASSGIADGALTFTDEGLFLGAVLVRGGERTLVPAASLASVARDLARQAPRERGLVGIAVQELTPLVAEAIGARGGVVITWVDPAGPAAGVLKPLDVVDEVEGQPLTAREQWDTRLDQLDAGDVLTIRIRRGDLAPQVVTITAAAQTRPARPAPLGATFRIRARLGAEVLRVEPGGAAEHAGLRPGDVVTALGAQMAPTPAQVLRLYADASDEHPLAVAVSRGASHLVLALEKTW